MKMMYEEYSLKYSLLVDLKKETKTKILSTEMNEFFDLIYKFHDSEKNDYVHFGNYI